jgi:hypothetical protein
MIRSMTITRARLVLVGLMSLVTIGVAARVRDEALQLNEPFKGITRDGTPVRGLFPVRSTGVSTAGVRLAATAFLASLTPEQKSGTAFPADSEEWRDWQNIHRYARKGINFKAMTASQRVRAMELLRASLSAKGLQKSQNIMRLNQTIAEMTQKFDEYGEGLYHITVMGEPSESDPWGWQLDGHHLAINYFVLRDQVVMTPAFMGSEPVIAEDGVHKGTTVMQDEQNKGLALMTSLGPDQRTQATLVAGPKTANNALTQAFRDNITLDFAGIKASALNDKQRALLLDVVAEYVNNMAPGHAKVRMEQVRQHLSETFFGWIGDVGPDTVFYYRIHSPVILIEFDHQLPVALPGARVPNRRHVHSVVRTPNGNDYGKDLLRQHYEATRANPAHGHQ